MGPPVMRWQTPVEDLDAPNGADSSHRRHISRRPGVMRMKPVTKPITQGRCDRRVPDGTHRGRIDVPGRSNLIARLPVRPRDDEEDDRPRSADGQRYRADRDLGLSAEDD